MKPLPLAMTAYLCLSASTQIASNPLLVANPESAAESTDASIPVANLDKSNPLNFSLDVAPGYRNGIFLEAEDGPIELLVKRVKSSPSKKWRPTFYLSFDADSATVRYYLNISLDGQLLKMYARTRTVDVEEKKELSNRTFQRLYDIDHEFKIKAMLDGAMVLIFVDDEQVDSVELQQAPKWIEVGASSGTFNVRLLSPPPPPAPE